MHKVVKRESVAISSAEYRSVQSRGEGPTKKRVRHGPRDAFFRTCPSKRKEALTNRKKVAKTS
jgi:hypothetical protein